MRRHFGFSNIFYGRKSGDERLRRLACTRAGARPYPARMINTRARGLANLHAGVATLCVAVFFWSYAEFILRFVPVVHLTRQVNLLPYFLCMVGDMALAARDLRRLAARFHRPDRGEAARLAGKQVGLMAVLTFTMMFATQDRSISRLFLGTLLVWSWFGLAALNAS